jgi:hypothetical protein
MSLRKEEYYQPTDLLIGTKITIYGRECLVHDCDAFTRQWFKEVYDQDMNPI